MTDKPDGVLCIRAGYAGRGSTFLGSGWDEAPPFFAVCVVEVLPYSFCLFLGWFLGRGGGQALVSDPPPSPKAFLEKGGGKRGGLSLC